MLLSFHRVEPYANPPSHNLGSDLVAGITQNCDSSPGSPTIHFLPHQLTSPFESRHRLIPYADLMIAWLAITLFGTTISLFSCVVITKGSNGNILNCRAGTDFAPRRPQSSSRVLKKSASGILASLTGSTYRSVRLASSFAAALLDSHFEHPG